MANLGGISQYQGQLQSGQKPAGGNAPSGIQGVSGPAGVGASGAARQDLSQLGRGSMFTGAVTQMKDGAVTISLDNGQTLHARLESGVNVTLGEPVLFQVKSNQNNQLMLRQVPVVSANNPTLQRALAAAGLPASGRNLALVNAMMQNQLPIDKNSLLSMMRQLQAYPGAAPESLIQMKKLGFPINETMVRQFEAYKNGQHSLLERFSGLMEQLPQLLAEGQGKHLMEMQKGLLQALDLWQEPVLKEGQAAPSGVPGVTTEPGVSAPLGQGAPLGALGAASGAQGPLSGSEAASGTVPGAALEGTLGAAGQAAEIGAAGALPVPEGASGVASSLIGASGALVSEGISGMSGALGQEAPAVQGAPGAQGAASDALGVSGAATEPEGTGAAMGPEGTGAATEPGVSGMAAQDGTSAAQGTLWRGQPVSEAMNDSQWKSLEQHLRQIPGMEGNRMLFPDGRLNASLSAGEMLRAIASQLEESGVQSGPQIRALFSGKGYQSLWKQAMSEQWLIEPRQVEQEKAVEQLYERLSRQMEKLEHLLQQAGKQNTAASGNASQVRGNLEMMQQINHLYNYVQLPLKLRNQNAHSDLYVYTNKKNLRDREGELSALLHLDLEHLGATDVRIRMLGTRVNADFCLEDEAALNLVESRLKELHQALERKGYQCSFRAEQRKEEQDFVQDFLEHEAPVGKLQRYSFDVLT